MAAFLGSLCVSFLLLFHLGSFLAFLNPEMFKWSASASIVKFYGRFVRSPGCIDALLKPDLTRLTMKPVQLQKKFECSNNVSESSPAKIYADGSFKINFVLKDVFTICERIVSIQLCGVGNRCRQILIDFQLMKTKMKPKSESVFVDSDVPVAIQLNATSTNRMGEYEASVDICLEIAQLNRSRQKRDVEGIEEKSAMPCDAPECLILTTAVGEENPLIQIISKSNHKEAIPAYSKTCLLDVLHSVKRNKIPERLERSSGPNISAPKRGWSNILEFRKRSCTNHSDFSRRGWSNLLLGFQSGKRDNSGFSKRSNIPKRGWSNIPEFSWLKKHHLPVRQQTLLNLFGKKIRHTAHEAMRWI